METNCNIMINFSSCHVDFKNDLFTSDSVLTQAICIIQLIGTLGKPGLPPVCNASERIN